MNVFDLRDQTVDAYASYMRSFLKIGDPDILGFVEDALASGRYWPDPLVQLNPAFESGGTVDELVAAKTLHPVCTDIFRRRSATGTSSPIAFHRHQVDALRVAQTGASYVLRAWSECLPAFQPGERKQVLAGEPFHRCAPPATNFFA